MSEENGFKGFLSKARALKEKGKVSISKDDLVELFCSDCDFYSPEEEENLECSSFKLLSLLLQNEVINLEQVIRTLS